VYKLFSQKKLLLNLKVLASNTKLNMQFWSTRNSF